MRLGAMAFVAILFLLAGCGFSTDRNVEETLEVAGTHLENAKAKWLLAQVEFDRTDLDAAWADEAKDPTGQTAPWAREDQRLVHQDLRHAHAVERRCRGQRGPGLCSKLHEIEAIVGEMTERISEPITAR